MTCRDFFLGKQSVAYHAVAGWLLIMISFVPYMAIVDNAIDIKILFSVAVFSYSTRFVLTIPTVYFYQKYKKSFLEQSRLISNIALLALLIDFYIASCLHIYLGILDKYSNYYILLYIILSVLVVIVCIASMIQKIKVKKYAKHQHIMFNKDAKYIIEICPYMPKIVVFTFFCIIITLGSASIIAMKMTKYEHMLPTLISFMIGIFMYFVWLQCMLTAVSYFYEVKNIKAIKMNTGKEVYSDAEHILEKNPALREKVFSGQLTAGIFP